VFNILLQVLDDGRLTDNKGRTADFRNTIVIMTSNIGSGTIQARINQINEKNKDEILEKTQREVFDLLKKTIRPEFLNRIDEIIMFTPLNKEEIREIVKIQFDNVSGMLRKSNIDIGISDAAVDYIATAGFDPQYGARPIKRVLQREVLNELSRMIISGAVDPTSRIMVDVKDGKLLFKH
jgi:ATP-dependent Clp protease ATP-binding subunit ClpB